MLVSIKDKDCINRDCLYLSRSLCAISCASHFRRVNDAALFKVEIIRDDDVFCFRAKYGTRQAYFNNLVYIPNKKPFKLRYLDCQSNPVSYKEIENCLYVSFVDSLTKKMTGLECSVYQDSSIPCLGICPLRYNMICNHFPKAVITYKKKAFGRLLWRLIIPSFLIDLNNDNLLKNSSYGLYMGHAIYNEPDDLRRPLEAFHNLIRGKCISRKHSIANLISVLCSQVPYLYRDLDRNDFVRLMTARGAEW